MIALYTIQFLLSLTLCVLLSIFLVFLHFYAYTLTANGCLVWCQAFSFLDLGLFKTCCCIIIASMVKYGQSNFRENHGRSKK